MRKFNERKFHSIQGLSKHLQDSKFSPLTCAKIVVSSWLKTSSKHDTCKENCSPGEGSRITSTMFSTLGINFPEPLEDKGEYSEVFLT